MKLGPRQLPPSRRDKKQIVAHLDPIVVQAVHNRRETQGKTVQEVLGEAVNTAIVKFGRSPLLEIGRQRVVKRNKARAQSQNADKSPACRAGKRRIAAWYQMGSVDRVAAFSAEVGTPIENLVEIGLKEMLSEEEIAAARQSMSRNANEATSQAA